MPSRLIFQVYVGPFDPVFDVCTKSVAAYAERIGASYMILRQPTLRVMPGPANERSEGATRLGYLPIFEKMNAFDLLGRHDQVAVIDADVWVRGSVEESVFDELEPGTAFGAVPENTLPLTREYATKVRAYAKAQYGHVPGYPRAPGSPPEFMNMGVMVLDRAIAGWGRDLTHDPRSQPFIDGVGSWRWSTDQTLLNVALRRDRIPMTRLPWKWNALHGAIPPAESRRANFVHFFLRAHHDRPIEELIKEVR